MYVRVIIAISWLIPTTLPALCDDGKLGRLKTREWKTCHHLKRHLEL